MTMWMKTGRERGREGQRKSRGREKKRKRGR